MYGGTLLRPLGEQPQPRHLAAQLDDDLLGRLQSEPLHVLEQDGIFGRDDVLQFARRVGRENHAGRVDAHARHAYQVAEQLALAAGVEPVKQLRILAHDVMHIEFGPVEPLDGRIGLQRYVDVVADARHVQDDVRRRHFSDRTVYIFVHVRRVVFWLRLTKLKIFFLPLSFGVKNSANFN